MIKHNTIANIAFTCVVLMGCFMGACSENRNNRIKENPVNSTYLVLYDLNGKVLDKIDEPAKVAVIVEHLNNMTPRYEKILPLYTHRLDLIAPSETSSWLFNNTGYMKQNDPASTTLYRFENTDLLLND